MRALALLALLFLVTATQPPTGAPGPCTQPARPDGLLPARVVRVVDGDTVRVWVAGREERVRLVGVDAPERFPGPHLEQQARQLGKSPDELLRWAHAAYAFARQRLRGQRAALELDAEERDQFGRLLAYLWVGGVQFNVELVREGYAWVRLVPPNLRHARLLFACQHEAQEARRGLWGP